MKPKCKCGKVCKYYGPVGGYSVACSDCNSKNAKRLRENRAKLKAERGFTQLRYAK